MGSCEPRSKNFSSTTPNSALCKTPRVPESPTVVEKHHADFRTLKQELSGELDWIVMKAMEKDRNRRYESANDLAKDVQRYLNDEPVPQLPDGHSLHDRDFGVDVQWPLGPFRRTSGDSRIRSSHDLPFPM
jgi:hypothetical protein